MIPRAGENFEQIDHTHPGYIKHEATAWSRTARQVLVFNPVVMTTL